MIVSKFGDHTPFYRQAEIYARQGIRLDRATLGNWSGRACFHLQPVGDQMCRHLAAADRVFMDETTATVLDPGRGATKKGYFWAIVSDDRGHSGPGPPIVLFRYASGRSGAFAEQFLDGFNGRFLQCDAYDGYDRLAEVARPQGPWTLVHCWSHLRRRFVKLVRNSKSPIAEAAVRQIAQLYAIEATVRGSSPDIRLAARKEHSLPIVAALRPWFEKQLSMISSGSTRRGHPLRAQSIANGIRCLGVVFVGHYREQRAADDLVHVEIVPAEVTAAPAWMRDPSACAGMVRAVWPRLTRFLADGRLELDTNPVENAIRPICLPRKNARLPARHGQNVRVMAITRKNALFAGSWATLTTLLQTAKMNDVDPHAWLTQTLERIAQGRPISNIDQLMPWNFKA